MTTIALPESGYHFELLRQNNVKPDFLLLRDGACLPSMPYFKNSQCIFYTPEEHGANFIKCHRANKRVYRKIDNILTSSNFEKFIIFNDAKPYHRFMIDSCLRKGIDLELWEDGLAYYIGTGAPIKTGMKNITKVFMGCYYKCILPSPYRRDEMILKDRFKLGNIVYRNGLNEPEQERNRIAFIGQPVVEDNYIGLRSYIDKIDNISKDTGLEIDYFSHPREFNKEFNSSTVHFLRDSKTEKTLGRVKYRYCITPFSTALVNLPNFQKRVFFPKLFGFRSINSALIEMRIPNVKIIQKLDDLQNF